jgi:[ribosomal protein S5]-alanine N-acetyltransferase
MTSSPTLERMETARLICERLRPEHLPDISRLLGDRRVSEWLWPHGGPTERDLTQMTAEKDRHWERYGFGMWLLRDLQTHEPVGWGGLQWTYITDLDQVEVAWMIAAERWGQGLATEMAHAALDAAFGSVGLREVIAFTLPNNLASRRVMEKAGFVYERDIVHALLPHVLYRRCAERF